MPEQGCFLLGSGDREAQFPFGAGRVSRQRFSHPLAIHPDGQLPRVAGAAHHQAAGSDRRRGRTTSSRSRAARISSNRSRVKRP